MLPLAPCGSIRVSMKTCCCPYVSSRSDSKSAEHKKSSSEAAWIFCMEPNSFGIIKGEQPLIRGSRASKSLRPCRAEHAAFASQTGLRLKSPTGAFTPSGHRRPFWFSFVRQKRTYPAPRFIFPHSVCAGWKTALQAAACAYRCATFPFPAPGHSPTCQRGCTARCARPPAGRL